MVAVQEVIPLYFMVLQIYITTENHSFPQQKETEILTLSLLQPMQGHISYGIILTLNRFPKMILRNIIISKIMTFLYGVLLGMKMLPPVSLNAVLHLVIKLLLSLK